MIHTLDCLVYFSCCHVDGVFIDIGKGLEILIINAHIRGQTCLHSLNIGIEVVFLRESSRRTYVFQPVCIVFVEALSDIWHHCPIKMGCADTAKLLQGLKLEDDRD